MRRPFDPQSQKPPSQTKTKFRGQKGATKAKKLNEQHQRIFWTIQGHWPVNKGFEANRTRKFAQNSAKSLSHYFFAVPVLSLNTVKIPRFSRSFKSEPYFPKVNLIAPKVNVQLLKVNLEGFLEILRRLIGFRNFGFLGLTVVAVSRVSNMLRWHVCRVNFARKIFFQATNFLAKNAPKISPKFLSLCSVGQKKSPENSLQISH